MPSQGLEGPPDPVPKVAAMSAEPPPSDFFSAVEAAKMSGLDWDMRPHVLDKRTGQYLLLDSGAQVTACPPDPGDQVDPSIALKAVNNARMKCYGYKTLEVQINRKKYPIRAIKTDVDTPILGWDFTRTHKLTTGWTEWGDAEVVDTKNNIKSILKYKAIPSTHPRRICELDAPVANSKSSHQILFEVASMEALADETDAVISKLKDMPESEYKNLLKKYPGLLELSFDRNAKIREGVQCH